MKKNILLILFLFIFSFSFSKLYAKPEENTLAGIDLCNNVFSNIKSNGLEPYTQSLVLSGENTFPYNILVDINSSQKNNKNLILVFYQEDVINNIKLISNLYRYIHNSEFDFNVTFLFSYGEKQIIKKQGLIYGIDSYIKNIDTNSDYTVFIIDLNNLKNGVITNSNGSSSPSWMIQNAFNQFYKEGLKEELPFIYLSQIFKLKIFQNRELSTFFNNNIPAIKYTFNSNQDYDTVYKLLSNSVSAFSKTENRFWDTHFLIMNFFGRYRKLSESIIIKIIIFISFCWLVFLFLLAFINIRLQKKTWASIKNIWFSIPVTFIIIFLSFWIGIKFFNFFNIKFSDAGNIYLCISFQLLKSLLFVSIFYLFICLLKINFNERAIDYLLVICSFINQSLFILVDISLFPIFMFICCLSIIALLVRNNFIHICILILMVCPFLFYAHTILSSSLMNELKIYIFSNKYFPLAISLILYPVAIVLLRIFTSIAIHSKNKKNVILAMGIVFLSVTAFLSILSAVRIHQINLKEPEKQNYLITKDENKIIDVKYTDKYIFSDIIRTVEITMNFDCDLCDFKIDSENSSPVLYTDNDYETLSPTSVFFKIPNNPPRKMKFSYGAGNSPSVLTVSAISKSTNENEYTLITKKVTIGD